MIALHAKRSPVSIAIQPHPCRLGKSKKLERKVAAVQYDNNQLRNCHVLTQTKLHRQVCPCQAPCNKIALYHCKFCTPNTRYVEKHAGDIHIITMYILCVCVYGITLQVWYLPFLHINGKGSSVNSSPLPLYPR